MCTGCQVGGGGGEGKGTAEEKYENKAKKQQHNSFIGYSRAEDLPYCCPTSDNICPPHSTHKMW
jgi:hypothetical protein